MDPYETLDVPGNATQEEITRVYRNLMGAWSVDRPGISERERKVRTMRMQEINAAYAALDPAKRASTDRELRDEREKARAKAQRRRDQQVEEQRHERQAKKAEQERSRPQQPSAPQPPKIELRRVRKSSYYYEERTYSSDESGTHETRKFAGGEVSDSYDIDPLGYVRAPYAESQRQDIHETLRMTREQWRSRVGWEAGADGQPLEGLEGKAPGVYGFDGRGAGVEGGPKGDLIVRVVHVDDEGQEMPRGFTSEHDRKPPANQRREPQGLPKRNALVSPTPATNAPTGGFWHDVRTGLFWGALILACLAIAFWFFYGR